MSAVLFMNGGTLKIEGARASNATSRQWYKQDSGGQWVAVAGQTAATLNITGASNANDGVYMLRIYNADGVSADSQPVTAVCSFLFFQAKTAPGDKVPAAGSDAYTFSLADSVGHTNSLITLVRKFGQSANYMGITTATTGVQVSSSATDVVTVAQSAPRELNTTAVKAGPSVVKFTLGAVTATINVTIS